MSEDGIYGVLTTKSTEYRTRVRWKILTSDDKRLLSQGSADNYVMAGRQLGEEMQRILRARQSKEVNAV